jgi:hypothetical protein
MTAERQEVHALIDKLAPSQVVAVHSLLTAMLDPVSRAIANAPMDEEPESESERQAVAEADAWLKTNEPIPFEDVLADFGLTANEIRRHKESE